MTSLENKKRCIKCNINKPLSRFYKRKYKTGKYSIRGKCKDCQKEYFLKVYKKTKKYREVCRNARWKRAGINMIAKEYDKKFKDQKGCCDLCGEHQSEFSKTLSVDHNHKTGNVRGLVCNYCNYIISAVEDWDKKVSRYLKKYGAKKWLNRCVQL